MSKKTKEFDPRSDLFCSNYTAVGTPTFGHKERSAVDAGFSEKSARNRATALLRRPVIQQRISELQAANRQRNNVSVDSVILNLTHDRDSARAKGDWQAAIRADELLGKIVGCFAERVQFVAPEIQRELDASERAGLCAIARIRLERQMAQNRAAMALPGGGGDGDPVTPQRPGAS